MMRLYPLFLFFLLAGVAPVLAQTSRPVIVSGGVFEFAPPYTDYATVNLGSQVIDTIKPDQSAQSVVVVGDTAFVATERAISRYTLNNYAGQVGANRQYREFSGIRRMGLSSRYVVVTRGYGKPAGAYELYLLNRRTLALEDSVLLPGDAEDLFIRNDTAFIAVPEAFPSSQGWISIVSLNNRVRRNRNLANRGNGIFRVFGNQSGGPVYTINTQGFGADTGFIARVNVRGIDINITYDTILGTLSDGYGIQNGHLLVNHDSKLKRYDLVQRRFVRTYNIDPVAACPVGNSRMYLTLSDYTTFGSFSELDTTGALLSSFNVGVAPEAIAVWNTIVSVTPRAPQVPLVAYPNPCKTTVTLTGLTQSTRVQLWSATGQLVADEQTNGTIPVSNLAPGLYRAVLPEQRQSVSFIKE